MNTAFPLSHEGADRLFLGLVCLAVVLSGLYVGGEHLPAALLPLLDVDAAGALSDWVASAVFLLTGTLLLLAAGRASAGYGPSGRFLLVLGAAFLLLSADEAVALHDFVNEALLDAGWPWQPFGAGTAWIPLYLSAGAAFFVLHAGDAGRAWTRHREATLLFGVGLLVFVVGMLGMKATTYAFLTGQPSDTLYRLNRGFEEFAELTGSSFMLYASLQLLLSPFHRDIPYR